MKISFKKLLIVFSSIALLFYPYYSVNSCVNGPEQESYRFWLFQPNLVNNEALIPFTYSTNLYFHAGSSGENLEEVFDSTFVKVNIQEWKEQLPSLKENDAYHLLYNTDPDAYKRQVKGDSLKQNTFYQALKGNTDLLSYFNFAKTCEDAFTSGDYTQEGDWTWKKDSSSIEKVAHEATQRLSSAKSPFIRQRLAYQLIKAYEYLNNTEGVRKIFDTYIKDSKSNSWIVGSAMYYYAKAQPSIASRNYWAALCFEKSLDKKLQAIKLLDIEQPVASLNTINDTRIKSLVATMLALRNPGRSLESLKLVYDANPNLPEINMLVEREINKLEDWLFSYKITGSDTYLSRIIRHPKKKNDYGGYDYQDPLYDNDDKKYEDIQKANWASDRAYLNEVLSFVDKIISENKAKDRPFLLLAGAHLAFLKEDFNQTLKYLNVLRGEKKLASNIKVQADLTELLCAFYDKNKNIATIEEAILRFDESLHKSQKDITDFETFRQQIYLFMYKKFFEMSELTKACLLSMKSERHAPDRWAEGNPSSGYSRIYAYCKPSDFDDVLRILQQPKTAFERFLANEKRPYNIYGTYRYNEKTQNYDHFPPAKEWDINKIKDYKMMYYIRHEQLDSALMVCKTIPRSFWQSSPYNEMLNCNPFYVALPNTHTPNVADSTRYDKQTCLERMVQLRNDAEKNPTEYAKNYYLLGNAYFSLSWHGNFWLMSDIYWGNGHESSHYFDKDNSFTHNYFGLDWARKQYELCLRNTKDERLAALCHFMIGYCANAKAEYAFYEKQSQLPYDPNNPTPEPPKVGNPANQLFNNRFPRRLGLYANMDYWCTHYENLALMYSGYKKQ